MSHDNYYGKFALLFGEIKFYNENCLQYRRHGNNVTGFYQIKMTPMSALKQAVTKWDELAKTHARVYTQTLVTLSQMERIGLTSEKIDEIRKAISKGGLYGVYILKKHRVKRKQFARTIGIYVMMLLGTYKKYINWSADK
jgi:rhamnosyltransferase